MSKVNAWETEFLNIIFNNTVTYTIGDQSGGNFIDTSTADGNLYVALFTADPTDTGSVANEATYTSYARVAVARTSAGWTVSGNAASNTAYITFAACTGGSSTVTHFGVCKAGTASVADILFSGALTASLAVTSGVTPQFITGNITATEN